MAVTLPYPSLVFVPLDKLTAEEMNQIVANYTALASIFPVSTDNIANNSITTSKIAPHSITAALLAVNSVTDTKIDSSVMSYTHAFVDDGEGYIYKFANGLQIITMEIPMSGLEIKDTWGSCYFYPYKLPDFPVPFIEAPVVNFDWAPRTDGIANANAWLTCRVEAGTVTKTSPGGVNIVRPTIGVNVYGYINVVAVGRWKY